MKGVMTVINLLKKILITTLIILAYYGFTEFVGHHSKEGLIVAVDFIFKVIIALSVVYVVLLARVQNEGFTGLITTIIFISCLVLMLKGLIKISLYWFILLLFTELIAIFDEEVAFYKYRLWGLFEELEEEQEN